MSHLWAEIINGCLLPKWQNTNFLAWHRHILSSQYNLVLSSPASPLVNPFEMKLALQSSVWALALIRPDWNLIFTAITCVTLGQVTKPQWTSEFSSLKWGWDIYSLAYCMILCLITTHTMWHTVNVYKYKCILYYYNKSIPLCTLTCLESYQPCSFYYSFCTCNKHMYLYVVTHKVTYIQLYT